MIKLKRFTPLLFCILPASLIAGEVDIPNTFSAGTPAVAADVNANFSAVETAVDGNAVDIASILATVTALEERLTAVEADNAALQASNDALDARVVTLETDNASLQNLITNVVPYMTGGVDAQDQPTIFFSRVNVHINKGDNSGEPNGLGNMIIGFDETRAQDVLLDEFCTEADPFSGNSYATQESCEDNNGIWGNSNQKIGSHYLVVGSGHSYTQNSGLVVGANNVASASTSSVVGGYYNLASGAGSVISGGQSNHASGYVDNISGGSFNHASGGETSISGGVSNIASGYRSSISGGRNNTASGQSSYIAAGLNNIASGSESAVSGGSSNTASGTSSSVSGGFNREASGALDWAAGSLTEGQ